MEPVIEFIGKVNAAIINPLLALIFVAALFLFLWGGFVFILGVGSSEEARANGKRHMLWGVVGMVIMVSVFSILQIGLATFGVGGQTLPEGLPLLNPVETSD